MRGQPKLLFPGLAGFYTSMQPVAYTAARVVLGIIIFVHGYGKLMGGPAGVSGMFTRAGLPVPELLAYAAIFLETVGALCIVAGLFTRFFAAALAIEMLIALLVVHLPKGFGVGGGGYEYVLLLGVMLFAVAIRGGGKYSVDTQMIGKEL